MRLPIALWITCLLGCAACTTSTDTSDAGSAGANAGTHAAGSGSQDAATFDGGSPSTDASSTDAAHANDAGGARDAQSGDDAGSGDAGSPIDVDASVCALPQLGWDDSRRSCTVDGDCAVAQYTLNCCGTQSVLGVRSEDLPGFTATATVCDARWPACGCATFPTQADDGTMADDTHPYATVACTAKVCATSFKASSASTKCGDSGLICDARTEICVRRAPVGPAIVFECKPVPPGCDSRRDCACASAALCTGGFNVCSNGEQNAIACECPLCQ